VIYQIHLSKSEAQPESSKKHVKMSPKHRKKADNLRAMPRQMDAKRGVNQEKERKKKICYCYYVKNNYLCVFIWRKALKLN
jgi:hypothetical protein